MILYIVIGALLFLVGFLISYLIFKNQNNQNMLYKNLSDLKKTIDDYKIQNTINSNEIITNIKETAKLAKALTTNQNLKGQFGENCLENVIKACYPNENIDYIKQLDTLNNEDKKIKPDFLIKLPNQRSILIDCKLNIEKYIEYKEQNNSNTKNEFIKDLNTTINNLSNKKYENAINLIQPDFILMYIPLETIVSEIYTDKDYIQVIKNSGEKNIIIVGNSSILTVIRLTKLLWAQNKQENNMQNIISTAENLYQSIAQHSQQLIKIKDMLNESTDLFNKEFNKLTKENHLFKLTEQLRQYGIKTANKRTGKKLDEVKINSEFLN